MKSRLTITRLTRPSGTLGSRSSIHQSTSETSALQQQNELFDEVKKQNISIPFSRARLGRFYQDPPELGNQFKDDPIFRPYLKRYLPFDVLNAIEPDLITFGDRVVNDLLRLHRECEENPPRLEQFDAWGRRVDRLVTSHAWKTMKSISAEEGLVSIAYEKKYGEWDRLYQVVKSMLFGPSAGLYCCPLSMTDGAAKIISSMADSSRPPQLNRAFENLTSRDSKKFWTSGQWMTERGGGSDVASGCETLALPQSDGSFRLHGYKWFSSATDSDMAMTLARIVDGKGDVISGTRGLSMFYLEVKKDGDSDALNNIEVMRLKNKLGTRQLPTAELLLDGTSATLVSPPGRGVPAIAPMLTITRLHNSLIAAASMRRVLNVARNFATKRQAFGKRLLDHRLHAQTLSRMEVETRAATLLVLEVARHLGKNDAASRSSESLLRILTPLMKLYTAKQAISCVSEGLEALGGQGYIEDTGMPGYLRDAQVLSIWEGTTNVLSLDLLRAIAKSRGEALVTLVSEVKEKIASNRRPDLEATSEVIETAVNDVAGFLHKHQNEALTLEASARDLAYSLTRIFMAALLVDFANETASDVDAAVARRWVTLNELSLVSKFHSLGSYENETQLMDKLLVEHFFQS